jgi:hypothetical protein
MGQLDQEEEVMVYEEVVEGVVVYGEVVVEEVGK